MRADRTTPEAACGPADAGFDARVRGVLGGPLRAASLETIQVNVGLACNLACVHCHVESSPARRESMDWPTLQAVLDAARRARAIRLDVTGGAPEMHPDFRRFVSAARDQGLEVMVRTNLTILLRPGFEDLPGFFRERRVRLIASLPCYLEENVDRQRGSRVHHDSIAALRRLNAVGYGVDAGLGLDLVYNPAGASLPPDPRALEADYRRELERRHGVRFTRLITITNMAIGRFLADLRAAGRADDYRASLRANFAAANVERVMCRGQVHVGHDGVLHDCDFNYALGLPIGGTSPRHVADFDPRALVGREIVTGEHCFGCTAGRGSSCGGALS